MRIGYGVLVFGLFFGFFGPAAVGQAGVATAAANGNESGLAGGAATSGILKPSLDELQLTLGTVKLERWKGGSVRSEAAANINSIQRDLQGTLAGLVTEADATPGSLGKLLAVSRNVAALYDVLVRVVDGARIAGPGDQVDRLQQAMVQLEKARQSLDERAEAMAALQEKQVAELQIALKTQAVPVCPVAAVAVEKPVVEAKKRVAKKKPAVPAVAAALTTKSAETEKPKP